MDGLTAAVSDPRLDDRSRLAGSGALDGLIAFGPLEERFKYLSRN